MPPPSPPQPPTLVNDDARKPDSLTVTWPDVADTLGYDARIADEVGNITETTDATRPVTFSGLSPTALYHIAARSKNADGVSSWSGNLDVRTRPMTPIAPTISLDAVMPVFLVKWQNAALAGAFAVLRQIGNGTDTIIIGNGPLSGERPFSSIPSGLSWQFLIQIVLPQADMPNGVNESFWSPSAQVTTVEALSSSPALRRTLGPTYAFRRIRPQ